MLKQSIEKGHSLKDNNNYLVGLKGIQTSETQLECDKPTETAPRILPVDINSDHSDRNMIAQTMSEHKVQRDDESMGDSKHHQTEDNISNVISELEKLKTNDAEETKACVSFYDFAGQYVFYSSHLTFMSPRAIYVLTIDLRKAHSSLVEEDVVFGDIYGAKNQKAIGKIF